MNIQALDAYQRVIVTRRPATCTTCGTPTQVGTDYAAVRGEKWYPFCRTCAASYGAQVKGLLSRIETTFEALPVEAQAKVETGAFAALDAPAAAVLQGQATQAEAYDTVLSLQGALQGLVWLAEQATREALASTPDPIVDGLRAVIVNAAATPKDRGVAESMIAQFERKGTLSDAQRSYAASIIARSSGASNGASAAPEATFTPGEVYLGTDGSLRRIYTTQNGYTAAKLLHHEGDHGSFRYEKGGLRTLRTLLGSGQAARLTQAEAEAFGREHGFCAVCGIHIDDDRSLAAGYGPVCAANNGWWYPTYAEAAEILGRPCGPNGSKA